MRNRRSVFAASGVKKPKANTIRIGLLLVVWLGATACLAQAPASNSPSPQENPTIDRSSVSYLDFSQRLHAKMHSNSIAFLMLADSLRDEGGQAASNMIKILNDHREQVTAAESFRRGRHSLQFGLEFRGEVASSRLVQKFTGLQTGVGSELDFNLIQRGSELIPVTGRIREQTGLDYLVDEGDLVAKGCGSITGDIGGPIGSTGASGRFCYEYQPTKMTALAKYVAQNQSRLARLESGDGNDGHYITDELFRHFRDCGAAAQNSTDCSRLGGYLTALQETGLGTSLPSKIRSEEQIRIAFRDENRFLFEDSAFTRQQIDAARESLGLQLTKMGVQLLDLAARSDDFEGFLRNELTEQQRTLLRQGKLLQVLADPDIRVRLMTNASVRVQYKLRQREQALKRLLDQTSYRDLPEDQKRRKFAIEFTRIQQEHAKIRAYSGALENTLLLISALSSDNPESFQEIRKAFEFFNNANKFVKNARELANAFQAEVFLTTAAVSSFSGGVGAVLTLMSLFSQGGEQSELQTVMDYLDDRFEPLEGQLQLLLRADVAINAKLDTLLSGQKAIMETAVQNARAIGATRVEIAHLNQAIRDLGIDIEDIHKDIKEGLIKAAEERELYFEGLRAIEQQQSLRRVFEILAYWLRPTNGVVEHLNSGDVDDGFIRDIQLQRETVVGLINDLSGSEFVYPADILARSARLHDRPPAHLLSMLGEYGEHAAFLSGYLRSFSSRYINGSNLRRLDDLHEVWDLHDDAFPEVDVQVFSGLPNPDVLTSVLKYYLTFALALNEGAQNAIGFSDLRDIHAHIMRLSESKKAAQQLVWPLFGATTDALEFHVKELKKSFEGGSVLQLFRSDNLDQWTDPLIHSDVSVFTGWRGDEKAQDFISMVAKDTEALDWLQNNGEVYFEFLFATNSVGTPWGMVEAIMSRILAEASDWRIGSPEPGFEWMVHLTSGQVEEANLEALGMLQSPI